MREAIWSRLRSAYQLPGTLSCFSQFSMSFTIPSSLICTSFFPFSADTSLTCPEYPGQPAAVEMPQLAASNSKFDAAEPVRGHGDAGPAADLPLDERTDGFSHEYLM